MTLDDRPPASAAPGVSAAGPSRLHRRLFTDLLPAPLWVLLLVLLLTVAGTLTVRDLVLQQQATRFDREVTAYQRELRQRFLGYEAVLLSVRASWEAMAADQGAATAPALPLSSLQFGRLIAGLDLPARFPGLSSVGYAPIVSANDRSAFARRLPLLAGEPSARLHPTSALPQTAAVVYLAPQTGNTSILGYDMYTEPVRRQAIERAVQSGQVRASAQVTLLKLESGDQDGLLLYLPIRSQGRVTGLLYAPLRISAVLPPLTTTDEGRDRLGLRILLGGEPLRHPLGLVSALPPGTETEFRDIGSLDLAGQHWQVEFSAPPGFGQDAASKIPWLVLMAGTLVSLLAALATHAQVAARMRAEQVSRSLNLSQTRLERSRAEFEAVFRAMQDTAVFTDPSGQVLFANDALKESFGISPFELRGSKLSDLHADSRLLARLDRLPGPQLVTTLFRRRGGETFYGEMQRSRVVGEGGETLGQLEVIRDVSERRQTDRALREGERRYQGVLEGMPQIVFLTDALGRVGYFNRRWWEYVGPQPGDARPGEGPAAATDWSDSLLRAIHPDDRADFLHRWQEALGSGRDLETEHRLRARGGSYRTFVTRGRPVRTAQGEIREWVGSSTDIDDQIYAEANSRLLADVGQALNDRHQMVSPGREDGAGAVRMADDAGLRQALDLMTLQFADSVAVWPSADLYAGPAGGAAEPPDGAGPGPLVAGRARRLGLQELDGLDDLQGAVEEVMSRREPSVYQGARLHPLGLSSAVLYPLVQDDQPLGVFGVGFRQPLQDRDLELGLELAQRLTSALDNRNLLSRLQSARSSLQELNNSLEERVAERTVQLSEANSELEAFSYSVSHDLRTPLRHILGFTELLGRETGSGASPKATRYLKVITDSADRMSTLIDDLLEFSRTSRAELRRFPVDLGRLVRDGQADLAPDQGDRQVEWKVGPLPTVIGDAGLLRQVVDNLLSNALKYTRTRERAVIEVSAQLQEREVWLSVRDNGVGFAPEYAGRLFGVFQRLHRTEDFEGTGIGLANVRRIVLRHGGRVWAESGQDGQPGATFWVALPLEPLSLHKGQPGERSAAPASLDAAPAPRVSQDRAGQDRAGQGNGR